MTHEVTMMAFEWREIVTDLNEFASGGSTEYHRMLQFLASRIERTCANAVGDAAVAVLLVPTEWHGIGRAWLESANE